MKNAKPTLAAGDSKDQNYEKSSSLIYSIGFRELYREAVLGYIFWSLFQAIGPMIWFYPLNELEISGYETFVVVLFSPALAGIPAVRRALNNRWVIAVLRLLTLASLASFQMSTTLHRLIVLALGCFFVMLVFTASFWSGSQYQRTLSCWGLLLGLFAFICSRVWFVTFVPTWWDVRTNSVVIALGAIATVDKILAGDDIASGRRLEPTKPPSWLVTGAGFGTLLYLTHWVFGEVSILCRWTAKGYPSTGPTPYPWGMAVLVALWFGMTLSPCTHVTASRPWWVVGSVALVGVYFLNTWFAFIAGLLLAVYTMSIWPETLDRLTMCPPARTLVVAVAVYLFEILFSVWTVAFNFVPGGIYTREHTDYLVATVICLLGLAVINNRAERKKESYKSYSAFVLIGRKKMPNARVSTTFLVFLLVGLVGFATRYPAQTFSHPPKVQPMADFTAAIWTYHFGYDNKGWPSLERSAQMLNNTGADVITLLESDASKPFLGNNDLGMWLGERLGMYVDFGVSTRDHTWGNLILSKYPIVKSTHHMLPSPHGELAPAITATINFTGHLVDFVVTHMGNDGDDLDRKQQAEFLSEELRKTENPAVFLGYVTSAPFSRDYRQLTGHGGVKDIDDTDTSRWCEYIMYKRLIRLGYARISNGGLSDTEVQMARFRIPENPDNYADHNKMVTERTRVDRSVRFSKKFGDFRHGHNWVPKHKYHMSTPKYFI
ncbi:PGAP2-interacting protein [Lamellibrachia satsuma]|nr:PGAP2-interacting protein [Lamellibrachia satsuma]